MQPNEISPTDAADKLSDSQTHFLDVRDSASHEAAHIPGSRHLTDQSVQEILDETPKDETVIVYCYHGNSSLQAAAWLSEQGFADVYSMSGGFETWRLEHPTETA